MEQSKLMEFVNASDRELREFLEKNPKAAKFQRLNFNDSTTQERMMRVGIEARHCEAKSEDDIFMLAVATLQNDHVKNERKRLTGLTPNVKHEGAPALSALPLDAPVGRDEG